jgi:hypothetical protein
MYNEAPETFPEGNRDAKIESEHTVLSSLIVSPAIGHVIFSSGNATMEKRQMDWALIETPDTFSPNRLPYGSAFGHCHIQAPLEILFR